MAQLWGGRFTHQMDKQAYDFNASIAFDRRLLPQDIRGSIAHVKMLAKQKILTNAERDRIVKGLEEIRQAVMAGELAITDQYEDVHSFVEACLIDKIGDVGKKMHTGRSRNDQVALQKAQPITLAHHLGAYFEMFKRDHQRLVDIRRRLNTCPLGSGALAGTTYPLDSQYVAEQLGFSEPTANSIDGVSDRDYLLELLSALAIIMMHLSRFNEEVIIWNSDEYRFALLDDSFSTGSSIMPQKKNPDIAELIRGKTGRVYGSLMSLLTTMKGLTLAYNKDMQEDKEGVFDAIDTAKGCLFLFTGMLKTMKFDTERMAESAGRGYTNATDVADYLVGKGVPFRDAHGIVGRLVLECIAQGISLNDLPLADYQRISPVFAQDVYRAISLESCVNRRLTTGAPGHEAMLDEIKASQQYLEDYQME